MYISSHSTYEYDKEKFIEYPKNALDVFRLIRLLRFFYFKNMPYKPESHHRVCILNQIPDMYITSPLKFLEEIFVLFVKNLLNHGWIKVYKILLSCQKSIYGTKIVKKWSKCITEENIWNIFWVMLILQEFVLS